MNLIEQLGGYHKAKECLNTKTARECILNELRYELLQYRRANNIFEVGDKVVYLPSIDNLVTNIREVYYVKESMKSCFISCEDFNCQTFIADIRHATSQEIAAGHRL